LCRPFVKRPVYYDRTVHINQPAANQAVRPKYRDNYVSTTKYHWWNFIFLNLWEQFHRPANIYFLAVAIVTLTPVSPIVPGPGVLTILIVLAFNAAREGWEDYKRFREDRRLNRSFTEVLRGRAFEQVQWQDVVVGDIVRVKAGHEFPSDLVLLSTSEKNGICHIETSNLDGEACLKQRMAPKATLGLDSEDQLAGLAGTIDCCAPNNQIETPKSFVGTGHVGGTDFALAHTHLLLRGASVQNTDWVVGVAVYTGHETKIMLNSVGALFKQSRLERTLNRLILAILVLELTMSLLSAIVGGVWQQTVGKDHWYLDVGDDSPALVIFLRFFTYFVIYDNVVPLSLYISAEFTRVIQAKFFQYDLDMYHAPTDRPMLARTSNLNEELGMVQHVFSDKTGTLTQNRMVFRECSIGGTVYGRQAKRKGSAGYGRHDDFVDDTMRDDRLVAALEMTGGHGERCRMFFRVLALCHTVLADERGGKRVYSSTSPDESALVGVAADNGFEFLRREEGVLHVRVQGETEAHELLCVLEFTSERKRMSVVVRTPEGRLLLLCKGADAVVVPRLDPAQPHVQEAEQHARDFAVEGLRVLYVAYRELDPGAFQEWFARWEAAALQIQGRQEAQAALAEEVEQGLTVLGVSAIEDKLQDGVPLAIASLLQAGVNVWVLTGDKMETAINISEACNLITTDMTVVKVQDCLTEEAAISAVRECMAAVEKGEDTAFALVIDGVSLEHLLPSLDATGELYRLTKRCISVVCCRVTPMQKCAVVSMVRSREDTITLAVGDGANDVPMLQKAHVGIGMYGQEGMQAVLASDYAVAQFRYLTKLLFVHGRWSYKRLAFLILYALYKNAVISFVQLWFAIHNRFSGQTAYDGWASRGFNVIYTAYPLVIMALFDRDVPARTLLQYPVVYKEVQAGVSFCARRLAIWYGFAIVDSLLCYWLPTLALEVAAPFANGQTMGMWPKNLVVYTAAIYVVSFRLMFHVRSWTWMHHVVCWGSLLLWPALVFPFSTELCRLPLIDSPHMFYLPMKLVTAAPMYFVILLTVVASLLVDFTWRVIRRNYFPTPTHIAQELSRMEGVVPNIQLGPDTSASSG